MKKWTRLFGASVLCLMPATAAVVAGDVQRVEMTNGDVLTGAVIERGDDTIILEHAMMGRITLLLSDVASVQPIELVNDTGTHVSIAESIAPGAVARGPASASASNSGASNGSNGAAQDAEAIDEEAEENPWRSRIEFNLGGSTGNTETLDIRGAFRTTREDELHRWRFDASAFYGESDGDRNKTSATAGVLKDWFVPDSPWLFFAQGRYDFDDFRTWTHRVSGHGGVGYQFIETDEFELLGRVGAGASKQWKVTESVRPEGLLGLELAWNISERQEFTAHTTLFPDLGDFFEFRVVSGIAWSMEIDRARGINITAGLDHEHESDVGPDRKKDDLRFYTGIAIAF